MTLTKDEIITIYRENIDSIYKYFFYRVLNTEIAQDLTSNTFLSFVKQINSTDVSNVKGYIKGIAHNIFNTYLKEKYRNKEVSIDIEYFDNIAVEEYEKPLDYTKLLERVLPKVPNAQRNILKLRFIDKMSIKEIAIKLGKDENYVSTTQKRAFATLRNILKCTDTYTNIIEE